MGFDHAKGFGQSDLPNRVGTGSAWLCDPYSCWKEGEYCFIAEMLTILKYDVSLPSGLYRVVLTTRTAVLYRLPALQTPAPGMMTAPGLHCSMPAHTTLPRLATPGAHWTPSAPGMTSRPMQLTALLAPNPPPTLGRQSMLRVLKPVPLTPKEETTPNPPPAPPVLTVHLPPIPDRDRHSPTVPPPLTTAVGEKQAQSLPEQLKPIL